MWKGYKKMKKAIAVFAVIGITFGIIYCCTGIEKCFLSSAVAMIAALISWIMYEMDLADQEIEMHYREWGLENQQDGMKLILTTTSIERVQKMREDLIEMWKEIA